MYMTVVIIVDKLSVHAHMLEVLVHACRWNVLFSMRLTEVYYARVDVN